MKKCTLHLSDVYSRRWAYMWSSEYEGTTYDNKKVQNWLIDNQAALIDEIKEIGEELTQCMKE